MMHEGFDDGPYGSPADAAADAVADKPRRTFVMKQPRKDEIRRQLEVAKGMAAVHAEEARRLRRIASYAIGGCLLLFVADVIRWLA